MKKRIFYLFLLLLCSVFVLSACRSEDSADTFPEDAVSDVELVEPEPVVLRLDDFLDKTGFVSAEKAYAVNRGDWHEMLGEPAVAAVTYDGEYLAECYLYADETDSWGHFIEFDYALPDVGVTFEAVEDEKSDDEESEKDSSDESVEDTEGAENDTASEESGDVDAASAQPVFTIGSDAADRALPRLIRYVPLAADDGDGEVAALDIERVMSASTLALNKQLFLKDVNILVERIGRPDNAELAPWGWVSWDIDPIRFVVYLDDNMNILYGHRVPLWDDEESEAEPDTTAEDDSSDGSDAENDD